MPVSQSELKCYKQLPVWGKDGIPKGFLRQHNTKEGSWAKLTVLEGEVTFSLLNEDGSLRAQHVFTPENQPPYIQPQEWHRIDQVTDDVQCQLSFYCAPDDFFVKKYKLKPTHSEILAAMPHLNGGKALDVGCGGGRNVLYLAQHGFSVDAWDINPDSLNSLNEIIQTEQITGVALAQRDFNQDQHIAGQYDFINSLVVLMFLQPETVYPLIQAMQQATKVGGYNLIVCAMDTQDYPLMPFLKFGFKEDELKQAYQGWEIVKYNEDVGQLHKTDEEGNRLKQRFATLLAKKIA